MIQTEAKLDGVRRHIGAVRRLPLPTISLAYLAPSVQTQKPPKAAPALKAFEGVGRMQTVISTNGIARTDDLKSLIGAVGIWEKWTPSAATQ
jgi:hypothetical protein